MEDPFPDIDFEALEAELRKEGLFVDLPPCQTNSPGHPVSECTALPVQQGADPLVDCLPDHLDFLPDLPLSPRLQSQFNLMSQTEFVVGTIILCLFVNVAILT